MRYCGVVWIPDGGDTCRFSQTSDGWELSGTALFRLQEDIARLDYQLRCDADWNSVAALVNGSVGSTNLDYSLQRRPNGSWELNRTPIEGVDGLLDIDLGFTPATNTNAIRRLDLKEEQKVETTALWLDISDLSCKPLKQAYQRKSEEVITYISPQNNYQTDLQVDTFGIVRTYPDLWQAV